MADTVYHSHTHMEEKSIGDLFSDLSDEIKSLVTNEIKLAKIEMKHKGTVVGKNSAFVVVGLTLLYAGFLGLMATAALALGLIISLWLAALIVSIVILIIGAAMAIKGVNTLKRMKMTPELAIESMEGERRTTYG
ncbi:MAG: phage holin family protein [Thermodesulfobacteriota bacterium]